MGGWGGCVGGGKAGNKQGLSSKDCIHVFPAVKILHGQTNWKEVITDSFLRPHVARYSSDVEQVRQ